MFRFIKEATAVVISKEQNELRKAISCMLFCMDKTESLNERFNSFDLAIMANTIKKDLLNKVNVNVGDGKVISECTPLDYASLYNILYKGSSVLFLRTYQDYVGPIE